MLTICSASWRNAILQRRNCRPPTFFVSNRYHLLAFPWNLLLRQTDFRNVLIEGEVIPSDTHLLICRISIRFLGIKQTTFSLGFLRSVILSLGEPLAKIFEVLGQLDCLEQLCVAVIVLFAILVLRVLNHCQTEIQTRNMLLARAWHNVTHFQIVVLDGFANFSALEDLRGTRPQVWLHCKHAFDHPFQVSRVRSRWVFICTLHNPFVEIVHVCSPERRNQGQGLVQDAAKRPDITLAIVRLVIPDLRTSIVWSARLCIQEACLCYFGDIHIAKTSSAILFKKEISRFDVSVEHFQVV